MCKINASILYTYRSVHLTFSDRLLKAIAESYVPPMQYILYRQYALNFNLISR